MDGPGTTSFSGGGEIASAFVTIGADLSGLRAAEQESRQISDRIGQMTANVGIGGGAVGAPSGGTSLFTGGSVSQSPSFGTTGGGFGTSGALGTAGIGGTTHIDIDTSSASQSVQRLTSDVRQLKEQLDMLNAAKEGFTSRGAAVPGSITDAIGQIQSQMGGGHTAFAPSWPASTVAPPFHTPGAILMDQYGEVRPMGLGGASGEFTAPIDPFTAPVNIGRHPRGISRMQGARMRDALGVYGEVPEPMNLAEPEGGLSFSRPSLSRSRFQRSRMDEVYGEVPAPMGLAAGDPDFTAGDEVGEAEAAGGASFGMLGRMGLRLAVFGAAFTAARGVASYAESRRISAHPDWQLPLPSAGESISLRNDPTIQALNSQLTGNLTAISRFGWVGDFWTGETSRRTQANRVIQNKEEEVAWGLQQEERLPGELLAAQGHIAAATATNEQIKIKIAQNALDQIHTPGAARDRAMSNLHEQQLKSGVIIRQSQAEEDGRYQRMAADAYAAGQLVVAAGYGTQANQLMSMGGVGVAAAARAIERKSLVLNQAGAITTFEGETKEIVGAASDADHERVESVRAAQLKELKAKQAQELSEFDTGTANIGNRSGEAAVQMEAEAYRTRLRGTRQFYQAQLAEINEGERAKIAELQKTGGTADQFAAAHALAASQRGALASENNLAWNQSSTIAGGQIAAAGYRASRNFYQANLANFNAGFTASLENIDLTSPHGIAQFGQAAQVHFAELRAMGIGRAQDLQLEREGYQGETTAANDLSADKPITAQADSAIARARRMVETASPEARPAAITAGQAMLRAQIHALTAQRGGETAIDMSYGQAIGSMYGSGIDLTGRIGDINNARKNLNQADSDLPNAKLTDSIDPATAKAFMDSVMSVLQVIAGKSGAALFN